MKLHIPILLRKALLAIFAAAPLAAVVSSAAYAQQSTGTTGGTTGTLQDQVVLDWITNYNKTADENKRIFIDGVTDEGVTESYASSRFDLTSGLPSGMETEDISYGALTAEAKKWDGLDWLGFAGDATTGIYKGDYSFLGEALENIHLNFGANSADLNKSVAEHIVKQLTSEGTYTIVQDSAKYTQFTRSELSGEITTETSFSSSTNVSVSPLDLASYAGQNKAVALKGSDYEFIVGEATTLGAKYEHTGTVAGTVDAKYSYYETVRGELTCDKEESYNPFGDFHVHGDGCYATTKVPHEVTDKGIAFSGVDATYTETQTFLGASSLTVKYGAVDYVLSSGSVQFASLTMADNTPANSFTFGTDGNTEDSGRAVLQATGAIDLAANSFTLQGGAVLNASTVKLTGVKFIGNSTPDAKVGTGNGGGAVYSNGSMLELADVEFDGNSSGYYGGTLMLDSCDLTLKNTQIQNSSGGTGTMRETTTVLDLR